MCLTDAMLEVTMCVLYILRSCSTYTEAILQNISIGGDSCGRAILLGAFYAASHYPLPEGESSWKPGGGAIPVTWIEKCNEVEMENVLRVGNAVRKIFYVRKGYSLFPLCLADRRRP